MVIAVRLKRNSVHVHVAHFVSDGKGVKAHPRVFVCVGT